MPDKNVNPPMPGKEIFRSKDKLGPIRVLDDGLRRFLAFDSTLKQSCVHKHRPSELMYEYTRAMALALAFTGEVKHCFIGGLGGGSLAHYLLEYYPQTKITALEYRAEVVKIAREYFYLPTTAQLDIHEQDLKNYLSSEHKQSFDVMLLDLYTAEGMHEQQKNLKLYKRCFKRLNDSGVMVINLPSHDPKTCQRVFKELQHISGQDCHRVIFSGGNFMVYAFKNPKTPLTSAQTKKNVAELSARTKINFAKILERIE